MAIPSRVKERGEGHRLLIRMVLVCLVCRLYLCMGGPPCVVDRPDMGSLLHGRPCERKRAEMGQLSPGSDPPHGEGL